MVLQISLVRGTWIYVIPVSGLHLTNVVNEEIAIERVTFITVRKLVRVRKRLGLPEPISRLRLRYTMVEFLSDESQVVAVLRHTGKPHEIEAIVRKNVTEALWLFPHPSLALRNDGTVHFQLLVSQQLGDSYSYALMLILAVAFTLEEEKANSKT